MSRRAAGELDRVCLHEYAHLAAARAFGACGFVRIVRIASADARDRFCGAFQMHGTLDEREWRVVALAGTLAEWLAVAPDLRHEDALARLRAHDALSLADAALAAGHDGEDVRRCLVLLRGAWSAMMQEAAEHAETVRSAWQCVDVGRTPIPAMTMSY
ncbi:MAG TPA: hypothetical protein VFX05_10510 [Casimicrobiaceae bacterium]|nr:hypothetical protein [Casimicrobiaceae bacterium]